MSPADASASATYSTPLATSTPEAAISDLMSCADWAERSAKPRTSDAITAKPDPSAPARVASTPAFNANRLVWNAISSITPTICSICCEDDLIASMADTVFDIVTPIATPLSEARLARLSSSVASACELMILRVSCSNAAAAVCKVMPWVSVRCDRSVVAMLIPRAPDKMLLAVSITRATRSLSAVAAALKLSAKP